MALAYKVASLRFTTPDAWSSFKSKDKRVSWGSAPGGLGSVPPRIASKIKCLEDKTIASIDLNRSERIGTHKYFSPLKITENSLKFILPRQLAKTDSPPHFDGFAQWVVGARSLPIASAQRMDSGSGEWRTRHGESTPMAEGFKHCATDFTNTNKTHISVIYIYIII